MEIETEIEVKDVEPSKLASVMARILDDKIGKDIAILNISNVSSLADYFVLCSGDTPTQVRALTAYVKEGIKKAFGLLPKGQEKDLKNRWNLLDYGDVVVHVLHKEERETYALEKFWNHAFRVSREQWEKDSEEFSEYI